MFFDSFDKNKNLEFYIDSVIDKMTVELPQDKIDNIVDLATEIYHSTSPVAIRLLSKFIGYLVSRLFISYSPPHKPVGNDSF